MDKTRQAHSDPFSRQSVRNALKLLGSLHDLGEHPLASLKIVGARRRAEGYADTPAGRGLALRAILHDAIEALRPTDEDPNCSEKRWRPFIIATEQYVEGRSPGYVTQQLGIAPRTYHNAQGSALDTLADVLRRQELSGGIPRPTTTSVIPRTQNFRGREEDLVYYLGQLEEGHLAVITGMPGNGKTALGAEIATHYQKKSDVFWMTFREGINTDADSLLREIAVYLSELGHAEFRSLLQLEGEADQRYPLHAKVQSLIGLLEDGNYTLCFDNFHLVNRDRDITTLFEILKERSTLGRTMHLVVMGQEKPAFAVDVELRPLAGMTKDDALSLLDDAGLARLPEILFDKTYAVTGGNPLFLDLFSRWVVENGLAQFDSAEATAQAQQFVEGMAQAPSIEGYLLVRVYNSLDVDERHVMELISAFRTPLDDQDDAVIEIFVEEGVENSASLLASLVRKHIATRLGDTGPIDCHPLIRQYFYKRLRGQLSRKRRLHGRIGAYYESFQDDHLEAAYHYREAADYPRSVQLLNTHREQLIGSGEARRMLDILSPLKNHQVSSPAWPLTAAIQGQVYTFLGEYDQALDRFEEALAGFEKLRTNGETRHRAADIARRIGRMYGWRGEFETAHARMEQGLRILGEPASAVDRETVALIHTHIGSLYFLRGQNDKVEIACQEALETLAGLPEGTVHAETYKVLGVIHDVTGRWEQAVDYAHRSLAIWKRLGNQHRIAELSDNLGTLHFYRGEFREAQKLYKHSLAFWDSVGARDNAGCARSNLGSVHLVRGQWGLARQYYSQALLVFEKIDIPMHMAEVLNNLGHLDLAQGNEVRAREYFQQSVDKVPGAENYRGLSEAELGLGHLDWALQHAQHSLKLAQELSSPFEEGATLRALGRVHQALGDRQGARQRLEESLSIVRGLGARYEMARTLYHLALLESESGEEKASQAHRREAAAIFEEVGARKDLERARSVLGADPPRREGQAPVGLARGKYAPTRFEE